MASERRIVGFVRNALYHSSQNREMNPQHNHPMTHSTPRFARDAVRWGALLFAACVLVLARPAAAVDVWTEPNAGIRHLHRTTPAPAEFHALVIDLDAPGVKKALAEAERSRLPEYRQKADDSLRAFFASQK